MSHIHQHLTDANLSRAEHDKRIAAVIEFHGREDWKLFEQYCAKTGTNPTQVVNDYIQQLIGPLRAVSRITNRRGRFGFLDMYSGQETEGHSYPVFFDAPTGHKSYDLSKMVSLEHGAKLIVYREDTAIEWEGTVTGMGENIMGYCQRGLFATLVDQN